MGARTGIEIESFEAVMAKVADRHRRKVDSGSQSSALPTVCNLGRPDRMLRIVF